MDSAHLRVTQVYSGGRNSDACLTTEAFFCETVGEKKWAAALRRDPTVISLAPYELFPAAFACECLLDTLLFAGRQEKGVALNLLHDVFPVPLAMETTQRVLEGISPLEV